MIEKIDFASWWASTKRKAYTHNEKKLNRSSDYEMYKQLLGVELDNNWVTWYNETTEMNIRKHDIVKTRKAIEEQLTHEEYDKIIEAKDTMNPYTFAIAIRDTLPHKLSNVEAWVVANIYLHRFMIFAQNAKGEIDFFDVYRLNKILQEMHLDWKTIVDSLPRTRERINKIVEAVN